MVSEIVKNLESMPPFLRLITAIFMVFPFLVAFDDGVLDVDLLEMILSVPVFLSGYWFLLRKKLAKIFFVFAWSMVLVLASFYPPADAFLATLLGLFFMGLVLSMYVFLHPSVSSYLDCRSK